jgi:PrtD family type I secretion system ABC transporter
LIGMASTSPVHGPERKTDPVAAALAQSKPLFAAAFGFSAAMSILALTTSFYMLQVYDRVLASRSVDTLLLLTVIAVIAIFVFAALDSLRLRLLMRVGMRFGEAMSATVLRAMVATTSQSGGMAMRSGLRDVETIRNFIGSPALGALIDAPFIVVYLVVLFLLSPFFLLLVVMGGAILVVIALANQRATNPPLVKAIGLSTRAHEFAEDGLRNADVLEGMGMSSDFVARWRGQWIESLKTGTLAADRDSRLSSLSRGVRLLIQIFLLGVGALLILDFQATGGIMIGASIIGARALAPIESIVSSWKSVIAVRLAWNRLVLLLERAPKRDEGMKLPAPSGRIQVSSVHYAIPATRKTVLANVSLDLAPGESLGIVGPSASGKSTLLRLMVGAWPCSSGAVRLDGADIYAWPRKELSSHIGYLPQDVELFAGTVRQNIARMTEGDPEAVARAAQRAGAHEMILGLPKGYDTDIGDYGHRLSGGQSQRIGIARALYGDPCFVVLDEPNSNLDGAGEDALLKTLASLKADGVTAVIVAHRPSILQNVDKMLVLKTNGSVDAFGPRAEVMAQFAKRAAPRPQANVVPLTPGTQP